MEYSDGLQCAAFTQDPCCDLRASDPITFKSLTIEGLDATNSQIRFRVLDDQDPQWLSRE